MPGWENEEAMKANASKSVLVTAACGGVGSILMQLAKAAGVGAIIAQTSTNNIELAKSLGATEVVDYKVQSLSDWAASGGEKVDIALDSLGGRTTSECFECLKDDGIVLSIRDATIKTKIPKEKNAMRADFFIMEPYGWQLDEIAALVESATEICVSFSAKSILPARRNRLGCGVRVIWAASSGVRVPRNIGSRQLFRSPRGLAA